MLHVQRWGPDAPQTPRLALSLRHLVRQVSERWPDRDTHADGWIGDAAHAARTSDHNPDSRGIVHAVDLTAAGHAGWLLVTAAILHPATAYVIYRGTIWSRTHDFEGRAYTGPNDHTDHVHVSILHTRAAETTRRRWALEHA